MAAPLLGCIADDYTGATDLASNLVAAGLRVVQTFGVPSAPLATDGPAPDAWVVALKSRTVESRQAVAQSLDALSWLQAQGAEQIYFKYCSTFDSTPAGNIGPVTEALMDALGADMTVACPAFPDNGRTVYQGHLFVGDVLLSESGMRHHPLTPMQDANLIRVMQAQVSRRVGLIDAATVREGPEAMARQALALRAQGIQIAVLDALSNADLVAMGPFVRRLPLVTAASGLALGWGRDSARRKSAFQLPPARGARAIVSGSCSQATQAQVADFMARGGSAFALDPLRVAAGEAVVTEALRFAETALTQGGPVLVYATAAPEAVRDVQARLGVAQAGECVEQALAQVARGLVAQGVGQILVAGGETSGACVQALGIDQMLIGPAIAPGVPWCHAPRAASGQGLHLALKSGNFGAVDFFSTAFAHLVSL